MACRRTLLGPPGQRALERMAVRIAESRDDDARDEVLRARRSIPDDFPNALFTSERIISLPMYPAMEERDVLLAANSVKKLIKYYRA